MSSSNRSSHGERAALEIGKARRWVNAATAALGLTAAMAVVAIAATAPLSAATPVSAASARAPAVALVLLIMGVGIVALGALVVLAWPARRRATDAEPAFAPTRLPVHWIWRLVAILVPLALGGALVAAAVLGARTVHQAPRVLGTGGLGTGGLGRAPVARAAPQGAAAGYAVPSWLPWIVAAIAVIAIAVVLVTLLRHGRSQQDEPSPPIAAHAAVQSAITALTAATDPRGAVIAAYAAMEGTLAAHGVPRRPAEAPREYLRRAIGARRVRADDAGTLTGLFEEARFSTHPLPERARERALSALTSLRTRLTDTA